MPAQDPKPQGSQHTEEVQPLDGSQLGSYWCETTVGAGGEGGVRVVEGGAVVVDDDGECYYYCYDDDGDDYDS